MIAIRNVVAIVPTEANEAWLTENCETVESSASWDSIVGGDSDDDNSLDDEVPAGAEEEPAEEPAKPKGKAKQVK